MKKMASKKMFGTMKPTPELKVASPKKAKVKKAETMEEYHKKRMKKLGMVP